MEFNGCNERNGRKDRRKGNNGDKHAESRKHNRGTEDGPRNVVALVITALRTRTVTRLCLAKTGETMGDDPAVRRLRPPTHLRPDRARHRVRTRVPPLVRVRHLHRQTARRLSVSLIRVRSRVDDVVVFRGMVVVVVVVLHGRKKNTSRVPGSTTTTISRRRQRDGGRQLVNAIDMARESATDVVVAADEWMNQAILTNQEATQGTFKRRRRGRATEHSYKW